MWKEGPPASSPAKGALYIRNKKKKKKSNIIIKEKQE
jgi:hypothetical protein